MTWRSTAGDAARVRLSVDPPWLMAPLFLRETLPADLTPAWQRWWAAALAFRPGGAALRQDDLVAFSPELTGRWQQARPGFGQWLAGQPAEVPRQVEQERLATFAARTGEPPAPRTLTVLVVPFGAPLFLRPEPDRLVVDAGLRREETHYARLLDPVLADFF